MITPRFVGLRRGTALFEARGKAVLVNTKTLTASVENYQADPSWAQDNPPTPQQAWVEVASAAIQRDRSPQPISLSSNDSKRTYTVPKRVALSAQTALTLGGSKSPTANHVAKLLSSGQQLTREDVLWVSRFFDSHMDGQTTDRAIWLSWGGEEGKRWAGGLATRLDYDSVVADAGTYETPGVADFAQVNDDQTFWAALTEPRSQYATSLFRLTASGTWQAWGNGDWIECADPELSGRFVELDEEAALYMAGALFDAPDIPVDLRTPDPHAWDLAVAAYDEIDWKIIDRATKNSTLSAAGVTPPSVPVSPVTEDYTPQERSENAEAQLRDANGRFAQVGDQGAIKSLGIAGVIEQADPATGQIVVRGADGQSHTIPASDFEVDGVPQPKVDPEQAKDSDLGLAGIVSEDKQPPAPRARLMANGPVLGPVEINNTLDEYSEIITATRQEKAKEFKRLLDSPEPETIQAAGEIAPEETPTTKAEDVPPPSPDPTPEKSDVEPIYLALVDRDDPRAVMDLVSLVPATATSSEPKTFRRSGGKWIEDPDVLQDLRSATPPPTIQLNADQLADVLAQIDASGDEAPRDPEEAKQTLMAAGGLDSNKGNAENLRQYWTVGPGGMKVRWNTGGDWTRCVRLLSKYLGNRAKGYCFTGDTEFLTRDGVKTFSETVGTKQWVLTQEDPSTGKMSKAVRQDGRWVEAPIQSYGVQSVLRVTLGRGKSRKVIKATPEHVWFASSDNKSAARLSAQSYRTDQLSAGMAVASLLPKKPPTRSNPSPFGVAAGFVFGDGHAERGKGAKVDLWGDKDANLLPYFSMCGQSERATRNGVHGVRVSGLPSSWKKVPTLDEGTSYLLGWLAGYIAADGSVSKEGSVVLSSSSRKNLESAADIANRIGVATYPIRATQRKNTGLGSRGDQPLYKMTFVGSTFPASLLVVPEHRKRFDSTQKNAAAVRWTVVSVEDHGDVEEVFCAEVPNTKTFALKDYVWVHNCALRHKEMTGVWPGDRKNTEAASSSLVAAGFANDSTDLLLNTYGVIRASAYAASIEAARMRVYNTEPFEPVPPSPEEITEGRSGRAFKIPLMIPEDLPTGDGRIFGKGALGMRTLPLPLMWQIKTGDGHDGSVLVGRIDRVERTDHGLGNAYGVFDTGPYGQEAQRLVETKMLRWVSADLDKFEVDESRSDPETGKMFISKGRLMGATLVPKPAFQECTIELVPLEEKTMPVDAVPSTIAASASIASAIPVEPPTPWFEQPRLNGPTPITVTDEGQLFGHIATWDTNHIGMAGQVRAPRSASNYAYFHTGVVRTNEGKDVKVGQLTLAGGHAPIHLDAQLAVRHYDDTASAIADVHAGEDSYGIWVAGALRPGTTPEQIRSLRASAPSGDWRAINNRLELVAVCQVNVPGFPVPRALAASGAAPTALVAAGMETLWAMRAEQAQPQVEAEEPDAQTLVAAARERLYKVLDVDGYLTEFKTFSPEKREALAKEGKALADGSFPIENSADLRRAVHAYGRAEESKKAKVRRHIVKRAKALGKTDLIPSNWKEASLSDTALTNLSRYDELVLNANMKRVQSLNARVNSREALASRAAALRARIEKK